MTLSKLLYKISEDNFYLAAITKTNCNVNKQIVKATKNDCYFNRYGFSLYIGSKRDCQFH